MQNLEITVSKNELLTKLKAVSKVINPSSKVIPAHSCFLFEIKEEFEVTGADESGNITATVDCMFSTQHPGIKCLVDSKTIMDGLRELPEQPITLTFDPIGNGFTVTVFYQGGKYRIQGTDSEGFSVIKNTLTVSKLVKISSTDFMHGIKTVHQFAGADELRPIMSSVYIESKSGNISFCATNGSTLALLDFMLPNEIEIWQDFELILPVKIAKIMADMLIKETEIELEITDKNVGVDFGDFRIVYRLLEGKYLNYRSVLPKNNTRVLTANTGDIISSLRRTSIFANKSSSLIQLVADNGKLTITGRDTDIGQDAEEIIPVGYSFPEIKIGFGSSLLLKCLETITTEEVRMTFSEPNKACLIMPDDVNIGLLILIMPLEINL